jgi:CO dehydrogenase/acetyl-CoA synthase alpha subunit
VNSARDILKSLVTKAQGKNPPDLLTFVKEKMKIQNELITAILKKIEEKEGESFR